jgi:HEAT repeat protein
MTLRANANRIPECSSEIIGYRRLQDLADRPLQKLVASLNALHEGKIAIPLLFIAGERAIRPLRKILLHESKNPLRIPRPQVVWALAELGARNVLLEYLATQRNFPELAGCQAEATVQETVIRALTAWDNECRYPLLSPGKT